MSKRLFLMAILCLLTLPAQAALDSPAESKGIENKIAGEDAPPDLPPADDKAYIALVDAAIADPKKAEWCKIRERYPDTSFYRALGDPTGRGKSQMVGKKLIIDRTPDSLDVFKKYLYEHFGNLDSHRYAAYLYRWNHDLTSQGMQGILPAVNGKVDYIDYRLAREGAKKILDCFVATGDGKSYDTAYHTIQADEMFILIEQYFHVDATGGQMVGKDGKYYIIVGVQIPETRQQLNIYFRLDDRMVALSKAARGRK